MSSLFAGLACTDEQRDLVAVLGRFCDEHLSAAEAPDVATERERLATRGLWAIGAAESIGGGGADVGTALIAIHRIAGAFPALALACVHAQAACVVLGARDRWQSQGEQVCAGAPVALVDGHVAELSWRTDEARLQGVVDRIDIGAGDPLLVVIDPDHGEGRAALASGPGVVDFGPPQRRTGLHGSHTRSARLLGDSDVDSDTEVPTSAARTVFRLGCAAVACGIAEAALDRAVAYAQQRVQFGGPLIDLPPVRVQLAEAELRARRCTQGLFGVVVGENPLDVVHAADVVGTLCAATRDAIDVAATAVQVHGGYGYLTEYGVERLLRDAVSLRAASSAFDAARDLDVLPSTA